MGRFNTTTAPRSKNSTVSQKTINLAGGEAYTQSPKLELVSILVTSFAQDKFYRSASVERDRISQLADKLPLDFVAKTALFARNEFGMRSISHVTAVEVAKRAWAEKAPWARSFFQKVVRRPDDMTEIVALWLSEQEKGKTRLPNSMKKGFAEALREFDSYQLAKYRGESKGVSLVDIVNLTHPNPTEAITALVNGTLTTTGQTWEAKLSEAGKAEDKETAKAEAWAEMISTKKIGQMALLKNLRNIITQAPDSLDAALKLLRDEKRIETSLILPFRYATAYDEIKDMGGPGSRKVMKALSECVDLSCKVLPLEGKTVVLLDESASMTWGGYGRNTPAKIGSLFAAVLGKALDADLITFSSTARDRKLDYETSVLSLADQISSTMAAGGTNFIAAFERLLAKKSKYDRIIILSDMQGWMGYHAPTSQLASLEKKYGFRPHVYSFDLQGYGSLQFPESRVYALAGFSDKVFDLMAVLEQDPKALVRKVEAVEL